jgi:hypothetical protein
VEISAKQLRQMASDVDDLHHQAMRDFAEATSEVHHQVAQRSRRRFVRSAGLATAGGALLAASGGSLLPSLGLGGVAAAQGLSDTAIAGYAQSVELAAVAAYTAAAPALKGDPLAVAQLFLSHHQQHADAFGKVAGKDARPDANPKVVAAVKPTLDTVAAAVKDGKAGTAELTASVLEFARVLENQAAYTYAAALTALSDAQYAAATSTILPIEAQHATVLAIALGKGTDAMFPTGAFESAAFGNGTDPKAGLDPAVFA